MHTLLSILESPAVGFVLKLFTGLAAAGFGILGLGADIRDEKGKLTSKGRIAFRGIVVAGMLAVATAVYDFATSQTAAKVEQEKSQRLMISVQRGIYPLRGVTAVFRLSFHQDFKDLTKYKHRIRSAISKDQACQHTKDFSCKPFTSDYSYPYQIPVTSSLFPKRNSIFRTVLDEINIRVAIYKALAPKVAGGENSGFTLLGSFLVDVKDHTPERWQLTYDYVSDTLAMDVTMDELPDSSMFASQVYSLVDFIPGAMTATPDFYGASFCDDLMRHGVRNCAEEVDLALIEGLSLDYVQLFFRYPKTIFLDTESAMTCDYASRRFLTLWFPSDIEQATSRLGVTSSGISPAEKHNLCEAMKPNVM